jgi:cellulose synthase/poly-beta-1,6-N-acetylglucosamine synthase-like glycosyltransferase
LERGARIIQAYYTVSGAQASASLELRQLAFGLVHLLRPLGRTAYGGSAGLKGTGMCFESQALAEIGWSSEGLAEDAEQHLRLLRLGYRVEFARRAVVSGFMAKSLAASREQHRRWEAGRLHLMSESLVLLLRGLRTRRIAMIDGAIEHFLPPLSVLIAALLAVCIVSLAFGETLPASVTVGALAAVGFYLAAGVFLAAPSLRSLMRAVSAAPVYVAWKLWTYARSLGVRRNAAWVRTSRDETP